MNDIACISGGEEQGATSKVFGTNSKNFGVASVRSMGVGRASLSAGIIVTMQETVIEDEESFTEKSSSNDHPFQSVRQLSVPFLSFLSSTDSLRS